MTLPLDELVANPHWVNERAQKLEWDDLIFEYEKALDDIQIWLRAMSDGQVRFKPAPTTFSIGEAVTHNAFSDEMLWNWVTLLAQGRCDEIDPAKLIGGAGARNDLAVAALEALNEACRSLGRTVLDNLPAKCDLVSTVPHPYFGRLNAKGWIYYLCVHHGQHLRQCEQVLDAAGFPRSQSVQAQPPTAYQPSARKTWLDKPAAAKRKKPATTKRKTASQSRSTASKKR